MQVKAGQSFFMMGGFNDRASLAPHFQKPKPFPVNGASPGVNGSGRRSAENGAFDQQWIKSLRLHN
jgi:hypothetical protein